MSDTIFNLHFAGLIFWSCILLCDLSLKRSSSGLKIFMIIVGVFAIDCALYSFTSFSTIPYAWYVFGLLPLLLLPLLYRSQLPIIIFTYMSSLLFSFIIQILVKLSEYILYLYYPELHAQFDSTFVFMVGLCIYLFLIPTFLRFVFAKIAKHASHRAMSFTWMYPIICFIFLLYNDYCDAVYTITIVRYMGCIIILMLLVYVMFYIMLTREKPIMNTPIQDHEDSTKQPQHTQAAQDSLTLFEKQYFESLINSFNDTLERSFTMEKGLQAAQRMLMEGNISEAVRIQDQLLNNIKDIQLLHITGNSIVDTLLSYYLYIFRQEGLQIHYNVILPEHSIIRDLDFCILFGSLLQNAYDALYECQMDHGEVLLECKLQDHMFLITCANTFIEDEKAFQKVSSNINLTCAKELCDKYNGSLHMECPKTIFYAFADIPL